MASKLTAKAVEHAKPTDKRQEIPDGLVPGLYLTVQPSGAKSWAIRYRHNGKPKKLTLGKVLILEKGQHEPEPALGSHLTLAGAREIARQQFTIVSAGRDPATERQQEKREQRSQDRLFESVAKQFIVRYSIPKNRSWSETARLLGLIPDPAAEGPENKRPLIRHKLGVCVEWKGRRIDEIRRDDVVKLLDKLVDQGKATTANRTLAAVRKLFNWAVERGLVEDSPAAGISAPASEKARNRTLSDGELLEVWQASKTLRHPFQSIVQMLVLTGQRREEVAAMRWSELDLPNRKWTLPAERMKKDREHVVPLSEAAARIVEAQNRIDGCDFVFSTTGKTPPSGFSKAKRKLDEAILEHRQVKDPAAEPMPHWTFHDLRRTMASGMARLGINLPIIERILAHESGTFGGIVAVYQTHQFEDEKRQALAAWADHLMALEIAAASKPKS